MDSICNGNYFCVQVRFNQTWSSLASAGTPCITLTDKPREVDLTRRNVCKQSQKVQEYMCPPPQISLYSDSVKSTFWSTSRSTHPTSPSRLIFEQWKIGSCFMLRQFGHLSQYKQKVCSTGRSTYFKTHNKEAYSLEMQAQS